MKRTVVPVLALIAIQLGVLFMRGLMGVDLHFTYLVGGMAGMVAGLYLLSDASRRFGLGGAFAFAAVVVILGTVGGVLYGTGMVVFFLLFYVFDLRRRGRSFDPEALLCIYCRSERVEEVDVGEHLCLDCGQTFQTGHFEY